MSYRLRLLIGVTLLLVILTLMLIFWKHLEPSVMPEDVFIKANLYDVSDEHLYVHNEEMLSIEPEKIKDLNSDDYFQIGYKLELV